MSRPHSRRLRWLGPAAALTAAVASGPLLGGCFSDRSIADIPDDLVTCVVPMEAVARGDALVFIRDLTFLPQTVRIRAGRGVTWVNCEGGADAHAHTSTADGGSWDSPLFQSGESFSQQFPAAGEFDYGCLPHPFMRGVVIVE